MERLDREMTVILALSLLDAAILQGQKGPVPRTNALRLALSYLHQRAGGDPAPFRAFWQLCADPLPWAENESIRCIIRASSLHTELHRIWRALGIPPDQELTERLTAARDLERRALSGASESVAGVP